MDEDSFIMGNDFLQEKPHKSVMILLLSNITFRSAAREH